MSADAHARLAAEHEALIQFLYLAPVGLVQTGIGGEIVMINPISAQLLMPLSRDGSLTNLFTALEDVAPELRHLCASFTHPSGMICDGLHIHLNSGAAGKRMRVPHVLSLSLLKLDGARLMAVLLDVSEQVRRERQLRQSDAWLNALLTGISDYALVGLDREGRISDWNETLGRLREADANGWSLDEGPRLRDIGDKRDSVDKRRKPVFCDRLTGVANRRAFFEAAELELTRSRRTPRPIALILFDADHFRRINDRHGHPAGDCVLRQLGAALSMTFRQVDVVARVGGEEFAVLLPSSTLAGAEAVAERLRKLVESQPVVCDGVTIAYTVSAGVAAVDAGEAIDLDTLIKRADRALYAAKANGRNRIERWSGDNHANR